MLYIKTSRFILTFILLNIIITSVGTCEIEYIPLPSDGIERELYEVALDNISTFSDYYRESNPLLQYYLANMEDDQKTLLFETNYQNPKNVLIMLPNDNQSALIEQHLSMNTDYRIPNLSGLAFNSVYQANYLFSNTTLYAECYEKLSCYNIVELDGFDGIACIIFSYDNTTPDNTAPQVVTVFCNDDFGNVMLKSTITYTPNIPVVFDSGLDYFEYGSFPFSTRNLFGYDSFIINEYSVE